MPKSLKELLGSINKLTEQCVAFNLTIKGNAGKAQALHEEIEQNIKIQNAVSNKAMPGGKQSKAGEREVDNSKEHQAASAKLKEADAKLFDIYNETKAAKTKLKAINDKISEECNALEKHLGEIKADDKGVYSMMLTFLRNARKVQEDNGKLVKP